MKYLFFALSLFFLVSCNGDDDKNTNSNANATTKTYLLEGKWMVTYLFVDNMDETNNLNSFEFEFKDNNVLSAQNNLLTQDGSWMYAKTNNEESISIIFPDIFPVSLIIGDWDVMTSSETKVELVIEDNVNGNIDFLTFSKI